MTVDETLDGTTVACPHCRAHLTVPPASGAPLGMPPLPMAADMSGRTSGKAIAAMVCGIVGLLAAGLILGIIAILLAKSAKKEMELDTSLRGGGMATAGLVLGVIDILTGLLFCGLMWAGSRGM